MTHIRFYICMCTRSHNSNRIIRIEEQQRSQLSLCVFVSRAVITNTHTHTHAITCDANRFPPLYPTLLHFFSWRASYVVAADALVSRGSSVVAAFAVGCSLLAFLYFYRLSICMPHYQVIFQKRRSLPFQHICVRACVRVCNHSTISAFDVPHFDE